MKKLLLLIGILGTMHTLKTSAGGGAVVSTNEPIENIINLQLEQLSNDEIAKRWLREGINRSQQNIDLSKYQHPIDWSQFEKYGNPYISADPRFIKRHYQGVLAFIAKEGYNKLIQGRCLFFDSTNTTEVTEQLYKDTITHISVYAPDILKFSIGDRVVVGSIWDTVEFIFQQRPDLTLIINFTDSLQTNDFRIPSSVKKLIIAGKELNYIGDRFFSFPNNLTELDLSSLSNIKVIGKNFLSGSSKLTKLDLPLLSKVTSVRDGFLFGCSKLKELDLSFLSNVRAIGKNFLSNNHSLTKLDVSPLSNITSVEDGFLYECSGLTQLDLSPLRNITQIGGWFLGSCSGIKELDLSLLSNITQIGEWFLSNCSGIKELDLSLLSNITIINKGFLDGCRGLIKLKFPNITSIKINKLNFLEGCKELAEIHIHKQLYEELGGATYFNNEIFLKLKGVHFYNEELQEQQRAGSGAVAINNRSTETLGKLSKKQMKKNKKK